MRNKLLRKIAILTVVLTFFWFTAQFAIALFPNVLTIFLIFLPLFLLWYYAKSTNLFVTALFVFFLIMTLLSVKTEITKELRFKHCFIFNVSYPGKKAYSDCIGQMTFKDYLLQMTKF